MKSDNYILINGWMVSGLKLKGNTLLIYAIIYGFSRDNSSKFTGSINYLKESINSSKNTVLKSLNELVDSGLIIKEEEVLNNIKFCKYKYNELPVQKLNHPGSKTEQGGGAEIAPGGGAETGHNKSIYKTSNLKTSKETQEAVPALFPSKEEEVLNFLNEKLNAPRGFKPVNSNLKYIKARFKQKYTLEDFKKVIVFKIKEWSGQDKTKVWLRPSTLFGEKFDSYLVQANANPSSGTGDDLFEDHKPTLKDLI